MDRKEFLKSLGMLTAGAAVISSEGSIRAAGRISGMTSSADVPAATDAEVDFPVRGLKAKVAGGPVKVIVIGA